jgi:hypothetical protein
MHLFISIRDILVGTAKGYRMKSQGSIPGGNKISSLLHSVYTHAVLYPMGTWVFYPMVKATGVCS